MRPDPVLATVSWVAFAEAVAVKTGPKPEAVSRWRVSDCCQLVAKRKLSPVSTKGSREGLKLFAENGPEMPRRTDDPRCCRRSRR